MVKLSICSLALLAMSYHTAIAQLIGPVGPTTSLAQKTHLCNILDYGAVADNATDVAPALHSAFDNCVSKYNNSHLVVPEGNFLINQSVVLSNATSWAFQLDGLITAAYGGNYSVERELILQGFAGVEALNSTINGEGDGKFLLDILIIVNGKLRTGDIVDPWEVADDYCSGRLRTFLLKWSWRHTRPRIPLPKCEQVSCLEKSGKIRILNVIALIVLVCSD